MKVLDFGELRLLEDSSASDLAISRAARVLPDAEWRGAADEKLLRFMLKNDHTSPFEHGLLKFYVKAPLFVINQWVRHRTWSFNIQSGRYEDEGENTNFYIPSQARLQDEKNRQNSIPTDIPEFNDALEYNIRQAVKSSQTTYAFMRNVGISREMARLVMPENKYSRMMASVDPHNFMHFLYLRMHKDAQWEIRQYAKAAYDQWADLMPVTSGIWAEMNAERIGFGE